MTAVPASFSREPQDWLEDVSWHRHMFKESQFRWAPEDPMKIVLRWTRARLVVETPQDFGRLDHQFFDLQTYAQQIDDVMVPLLREARERCPRDWETGLEVINMTPLDLEIRGKSPGAWRPSGNRETARALRDIPLPNPFSQVWELQQMRTMYRAAERHIEDAICDLAVELAPTYGWHNLAQLAKFRNTHMLQQRLEQQREERGEPGDPRRTPEQRYSERDPRVACILGD